MAEIVRPQHGCKIGNASLYEEVLKLERFELESSGVLDPLLPSE
jgi:hypothetical protein